MNKTLLVRAALTTALLPAQQMPLADDLHHGYRAVLVCVGTWGPNSGIRPLPNATRDCEALRDAYLANRYKVTVLLDGQATSEGIKRTISENEHLETLVIHVSGHGGMVREGGVDKNVFIPHGSKEDSIVRDALPLETIEKTALKTRPRRLLLSVDACRGNLIDPLQPARRAALDTRFKSVMAAPPVSRDAQRGETLVRYLFATQPGKPAFEVSEGGVYSTAHARLLKESATGRDIRMKSFAEALRQEVQSWRGPSQESQQIFEAGDTNRDFVLGRPEERGDSVTAVPLVCTDFVPGICNRDLWRGFPDEKSYCLDRVSPTVVAVYDQDCRKQLAVLLPVDKADPTRWHGRFRRGEDLVQTRLELDGGLSAKLIFLRELPAPVVSPEPVVLPPPPPVTNIEKPKRKPRKAPEEPKPVPPVKPQPNPVPAPPKFVEEVVLLIPVKAMPDAARASAGASAVETK
jgi:hypothetical protein